MRSDEAAASNEKRQIGKPNPLMMRTALRKMDAHSENSVMIGDRMDTDIVAGIESGLPTVLVLTGVTSRAQIERFPYRPTWVCESLADVDLELTYALGKA